MGDFSHYRHRAVVRLFTGDRLYNTQTFGTQSPYAIVQFAGARHKCPTHTSGGTSPNFGGWACELSMTGANIKNDSLHLSVYNENRMSDTLIGYAKMPLLKYANGTPVDEYVTIESGGRSRGRVRVLVHITPAATYLTGGSSGSATVVPAYPAAPAPAPAVAAPAPRSPAGRDPWAVRGGGVTSGGYAALSEEPDYPAAGAYPTYPITAAYPTPAPAPAPSAYPSVPAPVTGGAYPTYPAAAAYPSSTGAYPSAATAAAPTGYTSFGAGSYPTPAPAAVVAPPPYTGSAGAPPSYGYSDTSARTGSGSSSAAPPPYGTPSAGTAAPPAYGALPTSGYAYPTPSASGTPAPPPFSRVRSREESSSLAAAGRSAFAAGIEADPERQSRILAAAADRRRKEEADFRLAMELSRAEHVGAADADGDGVVSLGEWRAAEAERQRRIKADEDYARRLANGSA